MGLTIEITQLEIEEWIVNLVQENVIIKYLLLDSNGTIWIRDEAIFWKDIPEEFDPLGNPIDPPDNWYQLPQNYVLTLNEITNHAEGILLDKFINI